MISFSKYCITKTREDKEDEKKQDDENNDVRGRYAAAEARRALEPLLKLFKALLKLD